MWTDIKLLNCSEVDINYNHIPSFSSLSNQISWFNTKVLAREIAQLIDAGYIFVEVKSKSGKNTLQAL